MSEQTMKDIVTQCGALWLGIQKMPLSVKDRPDLAMFNHPTTHSTLCVDINKVTRQNIIDKLIEHEHKLNKRRTP